MHSEFKVSDSVKELVNQIIAKKNIKDIYDIKYQKGSEKADGFVSKTVGVEIITGKATFRVFIKSTLNVESTDAMPIDKLYQNEVYFYDKIYPEFLEICKRRGIENALRNIPTCYGTYESMVALENLNDRHFTLCDYTKPLNDSHIELVLKMFAKMHAITYAFKDQERKTYDGLLKNVFDFFNTTSNKNPFVLMLKHGASDFIKNLDPFADKYLLEKCDGLIENLCPIITSAHKTLNEYSILTHGDSHCNNILFKYEKENKEKPTDVILVDWQCIRPASPVYDLSCFFYPIAFKEALNNLTYYLKLYHKELSDTIRLLGSDPDILYPYEILEKEWKQHCKYGFAMAFSFIRIMLYTGDDVFNAEMVDLENTTESILPPLKKRDEYQSRMKILMEHMLENDFL